MEVWEGGILARTDAVSMVRQNLRETAKGGLLQGL